MKKYAYKGKVVYVLNQLGEQVVYSDDGNKTSILKTVSSSVFFRNAREIKPAIQNTIVVTGIAPPPVVKPSEEIMLKEPEVEVKDTYLEETIVEPIIEEIKEEPVVEIVKPKRTRTKKVVKQEVVEEKVVVIEKPVVVKVEEPVKKKKGSVSVYEDYI